CNVVPLTDRDTVILIRQFRHGIGRVTLEIPGGVIDRDDEPPSEAARRELLEETGYAAEPARIEPLGVVHPNPALQNNRCFSFVARGVLRVRPAALEPTEDIEVVELPLGEVPAHIASGAISHALVVVAFAFLFGLRVR